MGLLFTEMAIIAGKAVFGEKIRNLVLDKTVKMLLAFNWRYQILTQTTRQTAGWD